MVLIMNSLLQTMVDFPTFNIFLNGFGHLSKALFSPEWSVPWYSHCLEALPELTSCCRDPSTASLAGYSYSGAKRRKHISVCRPWGREGRVGKQQEPAGPGCAQGAGLGSRHWALNALGHPAAASHHLENTLHQAISDGKERSPSFCSGERLLEILLEKKLKMHF